MPNSISPHFFMLKLIIETQKYYRKKILVTKEGKFHFIK